MGEYIRKSHEVSALPRHIACPAKRRRAAVNGDADEALKEACGGIGGRHGMEFLEMGAGGDRARFLARPAPSCGPSKTAGTIKSITAKETFGKRFEVKGQLWRREFRADAAANM
ncbi:MAG: transposase [Treponema sp.]|nr:transposase [Treponema sp.]